MTKFEDVYGYLAQKDEKSASDICYALEYLSTCLEKASETILKDIHAAVDSDNETEEIRFKEYKKTIKTTRDQIENYLNLFSEKEVITEETEETVEDDDDHMTENGKVDYSKYNVDSSKPHQLSEDYEHTTVCGFMFKGQRYEVNNAQSMLIKLCELLYAESPEKISSFITSDKFKGRKIKQFSNKGTAKYYKQIGNSGVYVWVNICSNDKMKLTKKMLIEYGHKPSEFYVYLRADRKSLHNAT